MKAALFLFALTFSSLHATGAYGSEKGGGVGIHAIKSARAQIDVIGNTLWRNQQMWELYDLGAHMLKSARFLNNPKFIMLSTNPEVADFHLQPGSAGSSQVQGSGPDRGAHEFSKTK